MSRVGNLRSPSWFIYGLKFFVTDFEIPCHDKVVEMGPKVGGFTGLNGAEITSYCVNEEERIMNVEIEEERVDDRSVDDLLLFINSGNEDSKGVKPTKNKKKNRRRKNHPKGPSSYIKNRNHKKETDGLSSLHNSQIEDCVSPSKLLKIVGSNFEFRDDDFDDDLDPALMEELDREVEEFARRLNSVWAERVQGIIPFGQSRSIASVSRN
ncbi:hypothetical protein CTI12_AA420960 [Artemisia annua]|uniref:Uncharacterized protein n=1 Tax=Artemisia annua TaxID=35608 RepID=A0A2U1M4Q8_ARTAN|nr:hypothetical protein CTI12_AA420960 [Artemisia annua]